MHQPTKQTSGKITCQSPSNIALVKYWGKHSVQLPQNPSLSFTLKNSVTELILEWSLKKNSKTTTSIDVEFYFENKPNTQFKKKIDAYLESISDDFSFLKQIDIVIHSRNSFPHSAGIASSASSMSALALAVCALDCHLKGKEFSLENQEVREQVSQYARLGSGSACRSLFGGIALWGKHYAVPDSCDTYAIPFKEIHPIFNNFKDSILIVNQDIKSVSSSGGHSAMIDHIYAKQRYKNAYLNMEKILKAMKVGDLETFGEIVEFEALNLHALMMTSSKPYTLLKPNTLQLIEEIKRFRCKTHHPVYFTLDAGPNIHLLYPENVSKPVERFIKDVCVKYLEGEQCIYDEVGQGPTIKLSSGDSESVS